MTDERFKSISFEFRYLKKLLYLGLFCGGQELICYVVCWRTMGFHFNLHLLSDFIKINPIAGWGGLIYGLASPLFFSALLGLWRIYEEFCLTSQIQEAAEALAKIAGKEYYRRPKFFYFLCARNLEVFYAWALRGYEKESHRILEAREFDKRKRIAEGIATLKEPFESALMGVRSRIEAGEYRKRFKNLRTIEAGQTLVAEVESRAAQNRGRSPFEKQSELWTLFREACAEGTCPETKALAAQAERCEFVKDSNKLMTAAITAQRRWNRTRAERPPETTDPAQIGGNNLAAFD